MQIRELDFDPDHGYWLTWLILQTLQVSVVLPSERRDDRACRSAAGPFCCCWGPAGRVQPLLQPYICIIYIYNPKPKPSSHILRPTDFKSNEMWSFGLQVGKLMYANLYKLSWLTALLKVSKHGSSSHHLLHLLWHQCCAEVTLLYSQFNSV